jgi:sterol desaturase/sphingolipid hydroxylase (fatty acid hydroxylase superfamily)
MSFPRNGEFNAHASVSGWRRMLQWGLFPLVLSVAGLAAAALYQGAVDPIAAQMGVFTLSLLAVAMAQHVLPFNPNWMSASRQERRADICSWVVVIAVVDPLLKNGLLPALMSFTSTMSRPEGGLGWFPTGLAAPVQLLLAAAIAELGQYWMHRAAHGHGWLWSVHTMHHSPTRVSLLNGFRTNPINIIWHQLAGLFVLMLLGTPAPVIQMFIVFSTVIGVFQHANADLRYAGWNWLLGTADLHRWHHARQPGDANCNFGQNLVLWDQVFGTYRRADAGAPRAVGIEGVNAPAQGYLAAVWRSTTGQLPR